MVYSPDAQNNLTRREGKKVGYILYKDRQMKIRSGNFKVGEGKKMMDEWTSHPVRHLVRLMFLLGASKLEKVRTRKHIIPATSRRCDVTNEI